MPRQKSRQQKRAEAREQKAKFFIKPWVAVTGLCTAAALAIAVIATNLTQPTPVILTPTPTATLVVESLRGKVNEETYSYDKEAYSSAAEAYVVGLSWRNPKLRESIDKGIVAGVLYGLSPEELGDVARELSKGKLGESELEEKLQYYLNPTDEIRAHLAKRATIVPYFGYGLEIPAMVHFPAVIFEEGALLETVDDLEDIADHEDKHARDFHNLVGYSDDTVVIRRSYKPYESVSTSFLTNLLEVRASYETLNNFFLSEAGLMNANYSETYINVQAKDFYDNWHAIEDADKTDFEKLVWKLQREETPGIVPVVISDHELHILYELGDVKALYRIVYPEPIFLES